jgi:tryptophan synthase alpha chain
MTIEKLFAQLQDCRKEIYVPIILMGYMNPVLQYGLKDFANMQQLFQLMA